MFLLFVGLGHEPTDSHVVGKLSTTELHSQSYFYCYIILFVYYFKKIVIFVYIFLLYFNIYIYLLSICRNSGEMWRSGNQLWETGSLLHHLGPGDQIQITRLGRKPFYPLSHLTCPRLLFLGTGPPYIA